MLQPWWTGHQKEQGLTETKSRGWSWLGCWGLRGQTGPCPLRLGALSSQPAAGPRVPDAVLMSPRKPASGKEEGVSPSLRTFTWRHSLPPPHPPSRAGDWDPALWLSRCGEAGTRTPPTTRWRVSCRTRGGTLTPDTWGGHRRPASPAPGGRPDDCSLSSEKL